MKFHLISVFTFAFAKLLWQWLWRKQKSIFPRNYTLNESNKFYLMHKLNFLPAISWWYELRFDYAELFSSVLCREKNEKMQVIDFFFARCFFSCLPENCFTKKAQKKSWKKRSREAYEDENLIQFIKASAEWVKAPYPILHNFVMNNSTKDRNEKQILCEILSSSWFIFIQFISLGFVFYWLNIWGEWKKEHLEKKMQLENSFVCIEGANFMSFISILG